MITKVSANSAVAIFGSSGAGRLHGGGRPRAMRSPAALGAVALAGSAALDARTCILGAGPGGVQLASLLERAGRD